MARTFVCYVFLELVFFGSLLLGSAFGAVFFGGIVDYNFFFMLGIFGLSGIDSLRYPETYQMKRNILPLILISISLIGFLLPLVCTIINGGVKEKFVEGFLVNPEATQHGDTSIISIFAATILVNYLAMTAGITLLFATEKEEKEAEIQ